MMDKQSVELIAIQLSTLAVQILGRTSEDEETCRRIEKVFPIIDRARPFSPQDHYKKYGTEVF